MQRFLFIFIIIFSSCTIDHHDDYINKINHYVNEKNIDSLDNAVLNQLKIYDIADSTKAYINLCSLVVDSLIAWKQNNIAAKFAMLASSKESLVHTDSSLKNKIGEIAYKTVIKIFNFQYDDTCLSLSEIAYRNTRSSLWKNNMCHSISIMYHILGDKSKAAMYYNLCYQGRLLVQHTDVPGTLTLRNKRLASGIINELIFFNEYSQYDSSITYAKIGLQLDSLQNEKVALLKAYLAEALYYTGNKKEATKTIDEAWQLLQQQPSRKDILEKKRDVLHLKGLLQFNNRNNTEAMQTLHQALDTALKKNKYSFKDRYIGKICIDIAKVYQSKQLIDSALLYTHKALFSVTKIDSTDIFSLPDINTLYRENTILEACDAMASVLHEKYTLTLDIQYLQMAVRCYTISFETESKLMEHFTNDGSRLSMLKESKARSEKAIAACFKIYQQTKDKAYASFAFGFAENSKSIVLLESVKQNIAINTTLANDSNYLQVQKLQLQVAELGKRIYEQQSSGNKDAAPADLQNKRQQLENDLQFAKTNLTNGNSAYKFLTQTNTHFTLQDIQQKLLDQETAITEYFYGDSCSYCIYADNKNNIRFYKLDTSLHTAVRELLHNFTAPGIIISNPQTYYVQAYNLYRQLQLNHITGDAHKLIIIPDGILSLIPFDALLTEPYTSLVLKNAPYFIKQYQSTYGYSAATLMEQPAGNTSQKNIIAFAPEFLHSERKLAPLTATAQEIASIQNQLPRGKYFLEQQATLHNFTSNLPYANIIHIASHAFADTARNTMPRIEFIDSSLYLDELYAQHINAKLVVLSACETSIGAIEKSEGAMSIARGFYYAGAKNIITSLWSINDKSTGIIMQKFYANSANNNYPTALQNAKLEYLQNANATDASPYYWAAFIQIGADKHNPFTYPWWLFCLPVLLMIIYWGNKQYQKKSAA